MACAFGLGTSASAEGATYIKNASPLVAQKKEVRGLWIGYCDFYSLGLSNKSQAVYTANLRKVLKEAKKYGVNTVYFHARAFDDASWKSSTFKASKYLSSKATDTKAAKNVYDYDPFKIAVNEAHAQGMELHAWLNPYRVTHERYYDPASTKSTDRLMTAIKELLAYNIDGIHFDDYFYHAGKGYLQITSNTLKPKPGTKNVSPKPSAATKRSNVNKMVAKAYATTHTKSKVSFGISPAGNYDNCMNDGADITTWLSKKGYVDYLIPQIYWTNNWGSNGKTTMFSNRMNQFKAANKIGVPMYLGLALYRTGFAQSDDKGWGWSNSNMAKQVSLLRAAKLNGFVLFSAPDLFNSKSKTELANLKNKLYPTAKSLSASGVTLKNYNAPSTLAKGAAYASKGTITSSKTIKRVEVGIVKKSTGKYVKGHYYDNRKVNAKSFDVSKARAKLNFKTLPAGTYYYRIWVHPASGKPVRLINKQFTVAVFKPTVKSATSPTTLKRGSVFTLKGTVSANTTIKRIEVGVVNKATGRYVSSCYYDNKNVNAKSFNIARADNSIQFNKLSRGNYYYRIWAHSTSGKAVRVLNKAFTVK